MSLMKRSILGFLFCIVVFCFVAPSSSLAQTNKPADLAQGERDQTLKQLLSEVRELRLAIQRASISSTRFQMLIERVRIEQAHVDALRRQLESVHSQVAEMRAVKPQMELQLKDAQDQLDRTSDPNAHANLESRIKALRANLAGLAPEEERLRNREASLDTELQAAQSKLNQLNGQLDELMSELRVP